ncbi:right-handed parallel beta-helix repeat-containing protein [bacterium]|nr:right-handed parallel beta-helix repeat-containing protein [bacterium]
MKYSPPDSAKRIMRMAIWVTVWVMLSLISIQLIWDFPKQLFIAVTLIFLFCSTFFWLTKRKSPSVGLVHVVQLIAFWLLANGVVFGGVYHVDQAGWNWFQLTGYNVSPSGEYHALIRETPEQCRSRYNFISPDPKDRKRLIIRAADHEIGQTVVIPKGVTLVIEPGARLRFGAGKSLVSYSPIIAKGTSEEPIIFTAKTKLFKWGSVGVVNADNSVFEHVRFEHGRQARINGVEFVAGLTVIGGGVEVRHCRFSDMFGKDALNVQYGRVQIHRNIFENSFKDGLDLDGGSGEVSFNEFVNCGDEGIDLSENLHVRVYNNKILDPRGGRIGADHDLDQIRSLNALGYLER